MVKKAKRRRIPSIRPRGRPKQALPLSKPVAFRLPDDVIVLANKAANDQHVSRNKLVELVLRAALEPGYADQRDVAKQEVDQQQIDLFA